MADTLVALGPIVVGGLLLVVFARQGRFGLGIAGSFVAIVGLWLLAQALLPAYAPCPQGRCAFLVHLDQLMDSRWLFMRYLTPVFMAALASRPFLMKGRLLPGIAGGLGVIGIRWAIDMAPVVTCKGETVECEWAWVAFLFINGVAMAQGAAVVLIDLAMHVIDQRRQERIARAARLGG